MPERETLYRCPSSDFWRVGTECIGCPLRQDRSRGCENAVFSRISPGKVVVDEGKLRKHLLIAGVRSLSLSRTEYADKMMAYFTEDGEDDEANRQT